MSSRCSPSRFSNVVKNFNEKQREAVESLGFGSLLKLNDIRLRRTLINWLIERYHPHTRTFLIGRHEIEVTKMDVALIMGLRVVGTSVMPKHQNYPVENLMSYYSARCGQIDIKCLEKLLQTPDSGDDFKRTFVLFALCTLLAPKPRPEVSASFLQYVVDIEKISSYAWGEFVLENLFSELDTYKREGHKYIGGCIVLLQFWYYEHIQIPIEGLNNEPKKFPRLSEWDGARCLDRDKKEGQLGGYGLGEVIKYISPTPDEASKEEVKALLAIQLPISSYKPVEGRDMQVVGHASGKTEPHEEKDMIVETGRVFDGHVATKTNLDMHNMVGCQLNKSTKKRKIASDVLARIIVLEHAIEEQRSKNEEIEKRLSAIESATSKNIDVERNAKGKEDRFATLERALEEQRDINEKLGQRLAEIEKAVPLTISNRNSVVSTCTEKDRV